MNVSAGLGPDSRARLEGLAILERGWLSSNVIVAGGEHVGEATVIDTGHGRHGAQTVSLVAHLLAGRRLARIVNTHLHSDHCGGNAALGQAHGHPPVFVPPGQKALVDAWDEQRLTYVPTGQHCPRFRADCELMPGQVLRTGDHQWAVIPVPGHDPDAVMLFDAERRVLIAGDALWQRGFGVIFPELVGQQGFDDQAAALDRIVELDPAVVIPGHGAAFDDVREALARARERLHGWRRDPGRHARHAARSLIVFHVMEDGSVERSALLAWTVATPLFAPMWQRASDGASAGASLQEWAELLVEDLLASGALQVRDARIHAS